MTTSFSQLAIAELHESPLNPRTHYDPAALKELADSIAKVGVLTPLLVRPNATGYEVAAGHRRLRAARSIGLITLPCLVRDMDDRAFLECLTVENLQRDDLHPLEEARGFQHLMEQRFGYDIGKIAERCGRSHQYVYDRLRLLKLIPKAQELFLAGRFMLGHAILLARLSPADQERAIDPDGGGNGRIGGLFEPDHGPWSTVGAVEVSPVHGPEDDPWSEVKPVSVGEFQRWIDEHVRFDVRSDVAQDLFPETAQAVQSAEQRKQKVVHITLAYRVADDARDAKGARTYGEYAWKRADGEDGSTRCAYAVLGVVAAGPQRGEAFDVCMEKKKCETHWPTEVKAARQKAKLQAKAATGDDGAKAKLERQQKAEAAERAKREAAQKERARFAPVVASAIRQAVDKLPESKLVKACWDVLDDAELFLTRVAKRRKAPTTAVALLRTLLLEHALRDEDAVVDDQWAYKQLVESAEAIGVDVQKLAKTLAAADAPKPAGKAKRRGTK